MMKSRHKAVKRLDLGYAVAESGRECRFFNLLCSALNHRVTVGWEKKIRGERGGIS